MADESGSHEVEPSPADEKARKRAEKARVKEQRRAERADAREQAESELSRLEGETFGKVKGFRVFNDGTVQKERESAATGLSSLVPGRVVLPAVERPRAAIVDVKFEDRRKRKLLRTIGGNATSIAATLASGGYYGGGVSSSIRGKASLTLQTDRWVEALQAESDEEVAKLETLNDLLVRSAGLSNSSTPPASGFRPPPPPPPLGSTPSISPPPPPASISAPPPLSSSPPPPPAGVCLTDHAVATTRICAATPSVRWCFTFDAGTCAGATTAGARQRCAHSAPRAQGPPRRRDSDRRGVRDATAGAAVTPSRKLRRTRPSRSLRSGQSSARRCR